MGNGTDIAFVAQLQPAHHDKHEWQKEDRKFDDRNALFILADPVLMSSALPIIASSGSKAAAESMKTLPDSSSRRVLRKPLRGTGLTVSFDVLRNPRLTIGPPNLRNG